MSELYFKKGKRYDQERPVDGIWEIRNNGKSARRIDDLPSPMRIQLDQYRECLEQIIMDKFLQPSANIADVVSRSLDEFALILENETKTTI